MQIKMQCPKCKEVNPKSNNYCNWCGVDFREASLKPKHIVIAGLLIGIFYVVLLFATQFLQG
jgi:hypothetical protein